MIPLPPSTFARGVAKVCLGSALLLSLFISLAAAGSAGSKPNILFLFADDQTFAAVREFGLTYIDTPNLDRLVRRGTTFTHAYNMGSWSGAVCVASRTMLMTGRSLYDAGDHDRELAAEVEKGVMWPQLMKQAGYRTYFTG